LARIPNISLYTLTVVGYFESLGPLLYDYYYWRSVKGKEKLICMSAYIAIVYNVIAVQLLLTGKQIAERYTSEYFSMYRVSKGIFLVLFKPESLPEVRYSLVVLRNCGVGR